MKKLISTLSLVALSATITPAQDNICRCGKGYHAPIGVGGDHLHPKGEGMLTYKYMNMDMDGNRDGTDRVSNSDVLADFMVTPTQMTMEMHMFGGMVAPNDNITLMAMIPYLLNDMEHLTRMGGKFSTQSEGFGDLKTTALISLWEKDGHRIHAHAGVSWPTGSTDEKDQTPMGRAVLPYPMQLGSGTIDLLPGLTYGGYEQNLSWGAQALAVVRMDENDEDYTLGDRLSATTWASYKWCAGFSNSLRLSIEDWDDIEGADGRLNPMMVPTARTDLRGGTLATLGIGANFSSQSDLLAGHHLAIEWEIPIYQDLNGPQLETDSRLTIGWQKVW